MKKFFLKLTYGTIKIVKLKRTWIQPLMMSEGWALCYEDKFYKKRVIYRSVNKYLLLDIQDRLHDGIEKKMKVIELY